MAGSPRTTGRKTRKRDATRRGSAEDLHELAQALVASVLAANLAADEMHGSADQAGERVLLDVEIDGLRCRVTARDEATQTPDLPLLSPRESEIARMVALGYPNKTIAAVLEISPWTVGTHLRRIFAKLGVQSRTAMVTLLLRARVLDPDDGTGGRRGRPGEELAER